MKGIWTHAKGNPVFTLRDFDIPTPGEGEVLIKNVAVAANPKDWKVSPSLRSQLIADAHMVGRTH